MNFTQKSGSTTDENLSITGKNRHQYYETAIANASDSDKLIRQAEARGHERLMREEELRKQLKRTLLGVALLAVAGTVALWFLLKR